MYISPVCGLEVEMTDVEHLLIFNGDAAWFWIKVNLMLEMICGLSHKHVDIHVC